MLLIVGIALFVCLLVLIWQAGNMVGTLASIASTLRAIRDDLRNR